MAQKGGCIRGATFIYRFDVISLQCCISLFGMYAFISRVLSTGAKVLFIFIAST